MDARKRCDEQEYSGNKVYVGDLNSSITKDDLEKEFGFFGSIKNVWVAYHPSKTGFGFVEFYNQRDAAKAIKGLNGRLLLGSRLRVEASKLGRDERKEWQRRRQRNGRSSRSPNVWPRSASHSPHHRSPVQPLKSLLSPDLLSMYVHNSLCHSLNHRSSSSHLLLNPRHLNIPPFDSRSSLLHHSDLSLRREMDFRTIGPPPLLPLDYLTGHNSSRQKHCLLPPRTSHSSYHRTMKCSQSPRSRSRQSAEDSKRTASLKRSRLSSAVSRNRRLHRRSRSPKVRRTPLLENPRRRSRSSRSRSPRSRSSKLFSPSFSERKQHRSRISRSTSQKLRHSPYFESRHQRLKSPKLQIYPLLQSLRSQKLRHTSLLEHMQHRPRSKSPKLRLPPFLESPRLRSRSPRHSSPVSIDHSHLARPSRPVRTRSPILQSRSSPLTRYLDKRFSSLIRDRSPSRVLTREKSPLDSQASMIKDYLLLLQRQHATPSSARSPSPKMRMRSPRNAENESSLQKLRLLLMGRNSATIEYSSRF